MSFWFINATARSTWAAATTQQAQLEGLRDEWSGQMSVRYYSPTDAHLATVTHATPIVDTSTTPYSLRLGAYVAQTDYSVGVAAYCVLAVPAGADILRADCSLAGPGGEVTNPGGRVRLDIGTTLRVHATASLPATSTPSWRSSMAQWEWKRLTGTSIANTLPTVMPAIGTAKNRVEAWNGLSVIGSDVYRAGVGGHADWAGNEGYKTALGVETPGAPTILRQPTPDAYVTSNTDYYDAEPDGKQRPTSAHTYYDLHPDESRNQIVRLGVGSGTGDGNHSTANVDAFDIATADWLASNTLTDVPDASGISVGLSQCRHPTTGNIYVVGMSRLWRWNISDRSWTDLAAVPSGTNGTFASGRASLIDVTRNRLVVLGNAYNTPLNVAIFDLAANTWDMSQSASGTNAALLCSAGGNAAHHDLGIDRYVARRSWSAFTGGEGDGPIQLSGGEILQVHPETLAVSDLATTGGGSMPATLRGVWGLFQPMPALEGYVIEPMGDSDIWFLAAT